MARGQDGQVDPPAHIVHVLPADLARGAQAFARMLRDALDGRPHQHQTLAIFASGPGALRPDLALAVPSGRLRRLGFDPRGALALRRTLAQHRPDIVVAHGGEALKYAAWWHRGGGVLVYKKTGVSTGNLRTSPQRRLLADLINRADLVAAVSEEAAEEARRLFSVPEDRVMVAPNGRDPALFSPRAAGPRPGRPRLVFVGHLERRKRPERFLAVVEYLADQGVAVEAVMVGDGPRWEALLPRAKALGVEMLGRRSDVEQVLADGDVLVFPGASEGEGMPGVLIEAGLAGLPAVATAVPGASTVIDHASTGFVCPVEDFDALAQATLRLASDPALRTGMGAAARQRCLAHFTLAASAERWQEVLDRALALGR